MNRWISPHMLAPSRNASWTARPDWITHQAHLTEALVALKLTLEDVNSYLTDLKKPRRRFLSWVLTNTERDRFTRLNSAPDKALAVFSSSKTVSVAEEVCWNALGVRARVTTVGRLESNSFVSKSSGSGGWEYSILGFGAASVPYFLFFFFFDRGSTRYCAISTVYLGHRGEV
ncbi:hypothetical protein DFH07DRAFT_58523 [Mycena maculata]|uniref:Uncharacterized protein n=1 Tax=Mycena maculata TaxID=230809 RepID=A0AAD7N1G5_9AGAR|nr:hypothetical protein DFH07DRAFT_58523 [Mycena maculata]